MPIISSISGLRATLNDGLTPELIKKYVNAFHLITPKGEIVVGNDGRPSGKWIEELTINLLNELGRKVVTLGLVPTPTVQLVTEHTNATGGISITASHNPSQWNGLKFLNSNGVFLDQNEIENLWSNLDKDIEESLCMGSIENFDAIDFHIKNVLRLIEKEDYLSSIKKHNYKVVVDAVNASGSIIVPTLLNQMGCEIIELYCKADGDFPHTPEPLEENLTELAKAVSLNNADLGIAVDPDADRLVMIDDNGNFINEELTIVLSSLSAIKYFNNINYNKNIVLNLSSSRTLDDLAQEYGYKVLRSPVGEINVVKKIKEENAFIGGEGSGGVIFPDSHYGRDSLVGIVLVLNLIAQEKKSISEIISSLPKYKIVKTKINFDGSLDNILSKAKEYYKNSEINTDDGIKVLFDKSWVQCRKSNTEPIIRIIAEANTKNNAQILIDEFLKLL